MATDLAGLTMEHIRQSNLIENIDDQAADESHADAWRWIAGQDGLDLEVVLETHRLITADQLGEDAGRLRQVYVRVGGRICPPPDQVPRLVGDWLRAMQNWRNLDPRVMHVEFEHIHPFVDGNGRTGRCLMWWHELRLGMEPTLLRASERWAYYEWFRQPGDWDEFASQLLRRDLLRKIDQDGGGER